MSLLWLMSALYLTSLSDTELINAIRSPGLGQDAIYVQAELGYNKTLKGVGVFTGPVGVYRFLGIPFARPPVGKLRFKKTEPAAEWSGERDATKAGNQCPQKLIRGFTDSYKMDEDCLYLNVYTPTRDLGARDVPVMIWIHGGAYTQMAGSEFDGTTLAQKGVIVVTFNYRLGILGFMSTEDDVMPGNFGLTDQIEALKWVQKHIHFFGGDPNQVTIFGVSAGGTSVSLLIQSPLAQGLFHRAIMQSGVSLTPWAYVHPTTLVAPRKIARLVGVEVGCTQDDSQKLLSCLQLVDFRRLQELGAKVVAGNHADFAILPRVETTFGCLPNLPSKLLESGGHINHVDTIRGYAAYERVAFVNQGTRAEFKDAILSNLRVFNMSNADYFVKVFSDDYLGNSTDPNFIARQVTAVSSDLDFAGPVLNEIKAAVKLSPEKNHFLYKFDYRPSTSELPSWVTAVHGDDIPFLFGFSKFVSWPGDKEPTQEDQRVAEQLQVLWTNFAKTGNPTVTVPQGAMVWEPFSVERPQQLVIRGMSKLVQYDKPEITAHCRELLQKLDAA